MSDQKIDVDALIEPAAQRFQQLSDDLRRCAYERDALRADLERARLGLAAVEYLINDSRGVDGLHRNGDLATWDELRTGGRYEEWLVDFDAALAPSPAPVETPRQAMLDPVKAPGHADLMVPPESIDAFMEKNPLPETYEPSEAEIVAAVAAYAQERTTTNIYVLMEVALIAAHNARSA